MTPLNRWLHKTWLGKVFNALTDAFLFLLFNTMRLLGLIRWYADKEQCTISRAKVLWDEAADRGLEMQGAMFMKRPVDFYRVKLNGKWLTFNGLPRPKTGDTGAQLWMDDKAMLKEKLIAAGLPCAPGGSFSEYASLLAAFEGLQKPVIIKPRLGSRGRHTTTHIYTVEELKAAFETAKQLCYWVVMEEHLVGSVYRGTMIGGKLRGVLGGSPPRVTGDGVSTIAQLIVEANTKKMAGVKDIKMTPATVAFLRRTGLTLGSILPVGKTIDLTEKIGVSYGGKSFEITDETHPAIAVALEQAAAIVGDPLLGFDFIIEDVGKNPADQKWGIIECNGIPFIDLHHHPLIGKPNNVARHVWDLVV